jgi:subtilisin family serine protease
VRVLPLFLLLAAAIAARAAESLFSVAPQTSSRFVQLTNLPGPELLTAANLSNTTVSAVRGQVLVRFRPTVSRLKQQALLNQIGSGGRFFVPANATRLRAKESTGALAAVFEQLGLVTVAPDTDLSQAIQRLRKQPEILYAEPNYRLRLTQATNAPVMPNDFDFAQLWALHNEGQGDGTPGADIHAPEAWEYTTGDKGIVVAVIDTGIDYYHPDLAGNVWVNSREIAGNGLDDDGNGFIDDIHGFDFVNNDSDPMDDHGHGSHISGIIGAVANNQIGVAGVCWQVSLMAVKAFDENGDGQIDTAIQGIRYAIENGAQILNASWGNSQRSSAMEDVLEAAHQAGVIIIAAAGNDNSENPFYPAAYAHVIGVAATDAKDQRTRFSNFGSYVAVAAPGENIYSTLPNNSYDFFSGTSMSTPYVSGVAALVLSRHPEFTNVQLENILRNAVDAIPTDKYIGAGRINAAAAARVNVPLPEVALDLPNTISGEIDIAGTATGDNFESYSLEYGLGTNPTNWIAFFNSPTPVPSGTLFQNFATPPLNDGTYTFRLTARNAAGEQAVERASVQVSNVHITFPIDNDVLRAGEQLAIMGTVFGENRTYQIQYATGPEPTNWTSLGMKLVSAAPGSIREGMLAVWDTSLVAANQFYTLKLTATAQDGTTNAYRTQLIYLDNHLRPGWPQYLPIMGEFPPEEWRFLTVADLDQDGTNEIIVVDHGNSDGKAARLLVYEADGSLRWSKELASGYPYVDVPVVGDIDGDGYPEIFVDVGSSQQLFAFKHDGTPLGANWPVHLEATSLGKVLADLNGDGNIELVGYSNDSITHNGSEFRQLVVWDKDGNLLQKWEVPACDAQVDAPKMFPAVGNLDGQPGLEIVAVSGCSSIAAFKLHKPLGPIWTASTFGTFVASPVIGDLDQNGTNEIVIAAYDSSNSGRGGIYAFDNHGRRLPGWPVLLEQSFTTTPALADLLGDGQLEISIPSAKSGLLHLIRHDGFEAEGWPVGPVTSSSLKSSTIIGDVDGDGVPDILLSSPGYTSVLVSNGDVSQAGGIKAWRADGKPLSLTGNSTILPLVMEGAAGASFKAAPLSLVDLKQKGKLQIVAATVQDRTYLPYPEKSSWKYRSSIYVWDLDVPYATERMPWPMFQVNPQHTGYWPSPKRVDQPPVIAGIPNQIVPPGQAFFPINLDQYVDDPDNKPKELSWTASGAQALAVSIDSSRVATIRAPSPAWVGTETIQFTVKDPAGLEGRMSVSFEVRPGYIPPLAHDDRATVLEGSQVEIDVLANDRDPGGNPLSVTSVSKPLLGTVTVTDLGTLLYKTKPYARGSDSFSYVLSNGHGGMALGSVDIEITPVNHPPEAAPVHVIIDEGTPADIAVLATSTDPDGDPVILLNLTSPAHGAVIQGPGDTVHYTPNAYYSGFDSFDFTLADSHGATNQGTVTIMIKPVNHPPAAQGQSLVLNRNASVDITFAASDPDPGDTEFTFTVVDSPRHGTLWTYPKVATYYPTNGFSGADTFTYKANDGKEDGPLATVHLTIRNANNPPLAQDESVITKLNQSAPIHLTATDLDNDPLSYQLVTVPAHGGLSGHGANLIYRPKPGFLGKDLFTYRASDGKDFSQTATVSITVTDQNTPPVAQDFAVSALLNTPTNVTLLATDLESDPLAFHIVTRPHNGKLTGKGPVVVYSPSANFVGPDRFTFKANDGQYDSQVATVSIDVASPNHTPVSTNQHVVVLQNTATPIQLAVTDADGDLLNCPILKGPQHGLLRGLGTHLTYVPKQDYTGTDSFTYKAWDGHIYSAVATVALSITVPAPPAPPLFQKITHLPDGRVRLTLTEVPDGGLAITVSSNLVDWAPLTLQPDAGQERSLIDAEAPKYPRRFYRAQEH